MILMSVLNASGNCLIAFFSEVSCGQCYNHMILPLPSYIGYDACCIYI